MRGRAAKRKPYALQHVSDWYKTQEICNKTHEKEPYVLEHFPYECHTQKMWERAIGRRSYVLEFVPDWYKRKEMYERTVGRCPYMLEYAPYDHKTKEMCKRDFEREPCAFHLVPYQYNNQHVCGKVNKMCFRPVKAIMTIKKCKTWKKNKQRTFTYGMTTIAGAMIDCAHSHMRSSESTDSLGKRWFGVGIEQRYLFSLFYFIMHLSTEQYNNFSMSKTNLYLRRVIWEST